MEDKLLTLHTNLIKEGYDLPDFNTFKADMGDPIKSKKLHDNLIGEGYDLPDYDTFLNDMGLKKKDSSQAVGTPSEVSGEEQSQLTTEDNEKVKTGKRFGDVLRSLKSSSLRALGGIAGTPSFLNRTFTGFAVRPIVKAMGGTDEEANFVLDNLALGYPGIGVAIAGGSDIQRRLIEKAQKIEEKIRPIEGSIWQNIADGNFGDAGEILGRGVAQSIPYLAMTAVTAGGGTPAVLSTIGATSAAQQYGELEGVAEPKRQLNAWLYGGFEAAGELVTASLFRGVGKTFRTGKIKGIDQSFSKGLGKEVAKSFGMEGSSEAATQIGQNFTDIITGVDENKNLLSGVLDAFLIGGVSGVGAIGGGHALGAILGRTIASDKEVSQVQENVKQQQVLIDQLEKTDSDPVKEALKKSIRDLRVQADEVMNTNYELAQKLSPEEQTEVGKLYSVWDELQDRIDSGKLAEDEIPAVENTIKGIKDQIQTIKDNLITRLEEQQQAEKQAKLDAIKEQEQADLDKLKEEESKKLEKVKDVGEGETVDKGRLDEVKEKYDTKTEEIKTDAEAKVEQVNQEYEDKPVTEVEPVQKEEVSTGSEQGGNTEQTTLISENKNISLQNGSNEKNEGANITGRPQTTVDGGEVSKGHNGGLRYDAGGGDRRITDATVKTHSLSDDEANNLQSSVPFQKVDVSFNEVANPDLFIEHITESKKNKFSSSVYIYPREDYANMRLFMTADGKAGLAIKPDGDIVSVFTYGEGKGRIGQLIEMAIKEGGRKLDCFNTVLPRFYSYFGFEPVAKLKWDETQKPPDWDKETYRKFQNGEPDVIFMAYTGNKDGDVARKIADLPYSNSYEDAIKAQDAKFTSDTRQNTLENEAMPPGQGKVSSENIPPESTAKTSVKREETRFRKTQVNSLIQDQTLQQQEVAKIVDSKKERYTVLHHEDAVNEAKALIDELGVQGATAELIERTRDMNDFPKRNVARMVLLDFYSKAIVDPNASEGDKKVAFKAIDDLQSIIAKENTKAGQGTSLMRIWKEMQPAGVLEYVRRKIAVSNKKILDKKIGDSTLGAQLDELFNTLDKESQSIIQDILAGKKVKIADDIKTKPPAPRRYVPKERIKQEQDYRKSLIEQYKAAQGGTLSASITGLTKEQIELGGNLIASYIREGYYRLQDIVDKLKSDFKQIGIELNDTQADELLGQPKNNKETYGEFLDRQESKSRMREGEKLASKKISEVITAHWTERDELKRTLAQKLMDEAGLTETEAKRIEKEVLDKFDDEILKRSQKQLTKILGTQKIPTEKKQKGVVGKMIELVNMGALDEDLYRNLFAEKFKLVELNEKNTQEILRLANNIQMASGRGWLERDATIKLAKYIYELYPESRRSEFVDTWIAMSYANMLSGISTSVLNMASAGSNLLAKPIRNLTNISKWLRFIRRGIKEGYTDLYNPFGEMFYSTALYGIEVGSKEAAEVYINGDLNNKYVEDVAKKNQFRVTQLERDKYGKSKRFKPITVNIGGKNIDLNIFNLYKYAGRNLAAQDKLMLTTSYEMEIAHILRDKLRSPNLKGRALTKEVMSILRGEKVDMDKIDAELESDVKLYKEMTGKDMTELQKKIRKRELMLEKLPITKEEKEEAERLARSNIFTDDRGGMFATLAQGLGNLANRGPVAGLIVKPFVPFTKVVGNVSEYMMDHVPFYGLLRANGMSISTLAKKAMKVEGETAQMGEKGSRAYYEQMGRAWLGTAAFSLALLTLLGTDEEDFIELSGGYNKEGFKQRGRENAMPPHTLRVGNVKISYKNIPALAIPLSLIGNINDGLKLNQAEEDLRDRLTAALLLDAVFNSIFMVKDMSFLDGVQRGTQIMADAASADEKKWESIGEGLIKSYLGFATRPLPQNNNAIQQIWKMFDPTSYSQSDIQGMLGYAMGVQHFIGRPSLDQFGDVITSYPGETLMPYTHWLKIKGTDERWKFLAKYNAIPNKLYNRTMQIESADGIEKRKLEADELFEYTKRTGEHFSNALREYMSNTEKVAKRGAEVIEREKNNGETEKINGVREDIEKLWADAKDKAEIELFRWGSVKEDMPAVWSLIKQTEAYQPYQESKSIEGKGLTKSQLYEFNNRASLRYAKQIESYLKSDKSKSDKTKDSNKDGISNFQDRINEEWADAKNYVSRQMAKELRKSE